jgi:hypothetical protein
MNMKTNEVEIIAIKMLHFSMDFQFCVKQYRENLKTEINCNIRQHAVKCNGWILYSVVSVLI